MSAGSDVTGKGLWWSPYRRAIRQLAHGEKQKPAKQPKQKKAKAAKPAKQPKPATRTASWRAKYPQGKVDKFKSLVVMSNEGETMKSSSVHVMSIASYHSLMKADVPTAPKPAAPPAGPARKFPRGDKPTVKMKPVSDQEAIANLKAGKFIEKKMPLEQALQAIKALAAGYGNVSGGGALRASNRGFGSVSDLQRAMETMPSPGKTGPPKVYLPGVHNPKSPVRQALGIKRQGAKTKKSARA